MSSPEGRHASGEGESSGWRLAYYRMLANSMLNLLIGFLVYVVDLRIGEFDILNDIFGVALMARGLYYHFKFPLPATKKTFLRFLFAFALADLAVTAYREFERDFRYSEFYNAWSLLEIVVASSFSLYMEWLVKYLGFKDLGRYWRRLFWVYVVAFVFVVFIFNSPSLAREWICGIGAIVIVILVLTVSILWRTRAHALMGAKKMSRIFSKKVF